MKIATAGLDLPEGKTKHQDPLFVRLVEKFKPAKVSPYFFELLPGGFEKADAIAIRDECILDLLILDMEKIESRLERVEDAAQRAVLMACQAHLEQGRPLCDMALEPAGQAVARELSLLSRKPTVIYSTPSPDPDAVLRDAMARAGMMFFYTAGKQEVHAWFVNSGADAVTCAGKIHSDLARGFVKAEIVSCEQILTAHSMQDARARGLTRLVDRDFSIPPQTVLEIRFGI